jgi:hypothetical protein
MLGDGRHDVDGETVRLREIHCFKFDLRLHQVGDEGDVAGQSVQLGDDELGTLKAACLQSFCQPWPIGRSSRRSNAAMSVLASFQGGGGSERAE